MKIRRNKKGFTLIELIVVIAILGILAAILVPVISGFINRANNATDVANAKLLYNAGMMVLAGNNGGTFDAIDDVGVPGDTIDGLPKVGDYVNPWPQVKNANNGTVASIFTVTVDLAAGTVSVTTDTDTFNPQTGAFADTPAAPAP